MDVPGRAGRLQRFERGEVSWSPEQDIVASAFRLRNEVCFEWSRPKFDHDYFRYDISYNGAGQGQAARQLRTREIGRVRIWTRLQGFGEYGFTVKSCTEPLLGSDECRGWTIPVRVSLGVSTETPPPEGPQVSGVIAERWQELGAWAGPLGTPVDEEGLHNGVRSQRFENGSITTAPAFGPRMVVAAYQRHHTIEVNWGGADVAFNAFRVDAHLPGGGVHQEFVWLVFDTEWARTGIGSGHLVLPKPIEVGGTGTYFFLVFPILTVSPFPNPDEFPASATPNMETLPSGATPPVRVSFRYPDIVSDPHVFDVRIDVPALDGTPGGAFASHANRANVIARHVARAKPLFGGNRPTVPATEDNLLELVAHLQAASQDPTFRTPGELPSRILAHVVLRQMDRGHGQVGTSFDEGPLGSRKGDYDMALKVLMVIAYRYRTLLTEEEVEYLLLRFVPNDLAGPLLLALHEYVFLTEDAPETENHILMIESTRYLVNQLLFERLGDQRFDNAANGLTGWLLDHLQQFAKHDFLEFNSRPYQRMSLHALFNLHEFAKDDAVRTAARILLDYTMVKFAISSNRQRRICPFRRLKETTNTTGAHNEFFREGHGGDPVTGFFHMYVGPTDRDGTPIQWFPDGLTFNAVISGLADYRPPPAAYILALTRHGPAQHRLYHGRRPRLHEADEDADGGVEIYYHSPSFLLTAGGLWLNSGYGRDEFTGYKQVAIAQSTTLLITRALDVRDTPELDQTFVDLIRFDRWPSLRVIDAEHNEFESLERDATNTAVHKGFACGANLEIPDKWLRLTGAFWEGRWLFLDLNGPLPDYGPLGLYVAAYRTPVDPMQAEQLHRAYDAVPPKNFGLLYAIEADATDPDTGAALTFAAFKDKIRTRNTYPDILRWDDCYAFHTVDDHTYEFWIRPDSGPPAPTAGASTASHKYAPRIFKEDGQPILPNGFTSLNLVDGPYLRTPGGHDGRIEVTHPGCETPLVLDYRDARHPVYLDNIDACPQPWLDRARGLADFARQLLASGRRDEAVAALRERVRILERITVDRRVLHFDDFTTGPENFSVPATTIDTRYQIGSMAGGVRSTSVNNAVSPSGTPACLAVGAAGRLDMTLNANQYVRLELAYGLAVGGTVAGLGLNLHDGGADRIRTTILHVDSGLVNFNVVMVTPNGWTMAGQNVGAGEIEFRFADFDGPGGQDLSNVSYIIFVFQVLGSLLVHSIETRAGSDEQ